MNRARTPSPRDHLRRKLWLSAWEGRSPRLSKSEKEYLATLLARDEYHRQRRRPGLLKAAEVANKKKLNKANRSKLQLLRAYDKLSKSYQGGPHFMDKRSADAKAKVTLALKKKPSLKQIRKNIREAKALDRVE